MFVWFSVSTQGDPFGTSLFLSRERFMSVLWRDDLLVVPMTDEGTSIPDSARVLEIFLDYLVRCARGLMEAVLGDVCLTSTRSLSVGMGHFLLDAKFVNCLDAPELALRNHLISFFDTCPEDARASPLFAKLSLLVQSNFGQLGDH